MRGEYAVAAHVFSDKVRFIPTCVENIYPAYFGPATPSVHPHMRGEY